MLRGAKGTKMPRGDRDHIMEFLIPEVKYSTQKKIASVLSSLDAKIASAYAGDVHPNRIATDAIARRQLKRTRITISS